MVLYSMTVAGVRVMEFGSNQSFIKVVSHFLNLLKHLPLLL